MLNRHLFSIINRNFTTKIKKYDLQKFFYDPNKICTNMTVNTIYNKLNSHFSDILNLKSEFNTYNKHLTSFSKGSSYYFIQSNNIINKTSYLNITYYDLSYIAIHSDLLEKYILSVSANITLHEFTIYIFNISINYDNPLYFKILKIIAKFDLVNLTKKEQLMLDNINDSNIIMG
jgi:hypothetical protein